MQDIIWVQTEGNYTTIKTGVKKIVIKTSLSKFENQINSPWLIKSHRSSIINLNKVNALDKQTGIITMLDGKALLLGKTYRKNVLLKLADSFGHSL